MALGAGTNLGPYRILDRLGAGGMGEVYRAHDSRLNRTVAIKVLPDALTSDPVAKQRLEREARAVAGLSSPHICPLYDIGHSAGTEFLVMEYLAGETLRDRLARGRLPLKQAIRYGTDIAAALAVAHRAGVVHRDLKPANVMLTESGAMLLDFGIARLPEAVETRTSAPVGSITIAGTLLGTLPYMAPEQVEGRLTNTLTDIFAFGAVMYEMVSGRRAFPGETDASIAAAILTTHPTRLAEIDPNVPAFVDHLVEVCLAKEPSKRWQSAADSVAELEWVNSERLEQRPASAPDAAPQPLDTANRGVHGVRGWRGGVGALVATRGTDGADSGHRLVLRFRYLRGLSSSMRQHSRVTALASRFLHSTRTASRGFISDTSTSSPQRLYPPPREDARRFSHRMDSRWRLPARAV